MESSHGVLLLKESRMGGRHRSLERRKQGRHVNRDLLSVGADGISFTSNATGNARATLNISMAGILPMIANRKLVP